MTQIASEKLEGLTVNISEPEPNVLIIQLVGELIQEDSQNIFDTQIDTSIFSKYIWSKNDLKAIIIDLYHLEYFNSYAIAFFYNACKNFTKKGIHTTLVINRESSVYMVLETMGFFNLSTKNIICNWTSAEDALKNYLSSSHNKKE